MPSPRIHRSEPDQALLRPTSSQWQRERSRGPILPADTGAHLFAWFVATLGSAVVVGFIAGLLAVVLWWGR